MQITREFITGLKVEKRTSFTDDEVPGLQLRASPTGAHSWIVLATLPDGRRKNMTIGSALVIKPKDARERAKTLSAQARLGKLEPKATTGGQTVATLAQAYLASAQFARLSTRTRYLYRGYAENWILPALGRRTPDSLTRDEVRT